MDWVGVRPCGGVSIDPAVFAQMDQILKRWRRASSPKGHGRRGLRPLWNRLPTGYRPWCGPIIFGLVPGPAPAGERALRWCLPPAALEVRLHRQRLERARDARQAVPAPSPLLVRVALGASALAGAAALTRRQRAKFAAWLRAARRGSVARRTRRACALRARHVVRVAHGVHGRRR